MSIVKIPGMSPIWLQWEDNNRINGLTKRTGFSEPEVIQRALQCYEKVLDYDNGNGCFDCFSHCYESSIEEFDIDKLPCGCSAKALYINRLKSHIDGLNRRIKELTGEVSMRGQLTHIVFKSGIPYRMQWQIDDNGCKTLLSEERVKMLFETDPDNYIGAACRLCGQLWSLPKHYEDSINAEHGWECPNCRRKYET